MASQAKTEFESFEWKLRSDYSRECLLGEDHTLPQKFHHRKSRWLSITLTAANVFLFVVTCFLWLPSLLSGVDQNYPWKVVSLYSPLFDKDIDFDVDESTKNQTLWAADETTSIYLQDPSPEVDAAWEYISAYGKPIIALDQTEVQRLGRDPQIIVKAPSGWGLGTDAYLGQINVFHEIHCLNALRKEMWWDHYHQPKFGDRAHEPYLHIRHKRHCLRKVLQALMCSANVDIVTHNWRRGTLHPIADFDNPRRCRNFEGLLEWNNENGIPVDEETWRTIKRPDNAVVLPKATPNLYTPEGSEEWINSL